MDSDIVGYLGVFSSNPDVFESPLLPYVDRSSVSVSG
jgi:hypothetical protein